MTGTRRHDAIAIAILALLPAILFFDVLIGTHGFYLRDLAHYNFPLKHVLREVVLGGEFPFWNRFVGAGQPLAANPQHEVFYPLTWLVLLPDYFRGFQLLILAHVWVGLFSMYALLRSMAIRIPASFFGAVSFGLGGLCMSYVNLLPFLFSVVWMPATLLFARRLLLRPSCHDFALASLFLGLQLLVGEPTTILQTVALLGAYAAWRGWRAAPPERGRRAAAVVLRNLALAGAVVLCGAAAGAVQLLPAIDHAGDSVRSLAFHFRMVSDWSMPPQRLAELFYPNVLGYPFVDHEPRYWGRHLYGARSSPFLYSIYPGLLAASLAAAGLFVRQRGRGLVLLLLGGSVLLALGRHTPLLLVLYDLGVMQSLRYPEKFILAGCFTIVVFAAQVLDRLLAGDEAVRRTATRIAGLVAALAALAAAASFTAAYAGAFARFWDVSTAELPSRVLLSRAGWFTAAVRGSAVVALLFFLPRLRRPLWLATAAAFLLADLVPVASGVNPRLPSSFFTARPPAAAGAAEALGGRARLFHEAQWGQDAAMMAILSSGGAAYWQLHDGLFATVPARYGIAMAMDQDVDRTSLLPTAYFTAAWREARRSGGESSWLPFAAMSNVGLRAVLRQSGGEQRIELTRTGDFPRYYFAREVVTIDHARDFTRLLSTRRFHPSVAFVPTPAFPPAPGVVHRWTETANTAAIDAESAGRSFLVMSVTPHKYWRVTLDGRPVTPVLTNLGYQGIVFPPGRHRVEMTYRNTLVLPSAALSLVAVAALAVAASAGRRRGVGAPGRPVTSTARALH